MNATHDEPSHSPGRPGVSEPIPLCAGPWGLEFEDGGLRCLRLGRHEAIRRIHATVRDHVWGTVPAEVSDVAVDNTADSFRIRFMSTHRQRDIHFVWRGEITGGSDGSLRFGFEGEAKSNFLANRIGLCVLHPLECAGARCRVRHIEGRHEDAVFPELVEARQPVPGIGDLVAFAHQVAPGTWVGIEYEGDVFEMEDQRNWIDASFKTFCPPLHRPRPVQVTAGTRIRQSVQVGVSGRLPSEVVSVSDEPVPVTIGSVRQPVPRIGVAAASHGQPLTQQEVERLSRLRLRHLRVEVRLAVPGWSAGLRSVVKDATALGVPLELAVHLPREGGNSDLAELARVLGGLQIRPVRMLSHRDGEATVSAASLALIRRHLHPFGVPIGAGSDADFYQLNQFRPPHEEADFIHWTMNPQVHAFDTRSLMETPAAIPAQLRSASRYFPGRPLVISAVTLKPRFNPMTHATGGEVPSGALPPQVDPRQPAPLAACWTLAVLKHLAESGAASVTLFETTGWRGLMETRAGSPLPKQFPSLPGQLFPVYHALAEFSCFDGGTVIATSSGDSLRAEATTLIGEGRAAVLVVNLSGQPRRATLHGRGRLTRERPVDWIRTDGWRREPGMWINDPGMAFPTPAKLPFDVDLEPWSWVRLELEIR